jgi:glycerate 2-kinase
MPRMASHPAIGVPTDVLVVTDGYAGAFSAELVAGALQRGLAASGQPALVSTLADPGYDLKMRAARAVITGMGRLDRRSLVGTVLSEVATRARQAGVPCHAVVGYSALDLFDLRILDLQLVLEAKTLAEIEAAGAELGAAILADVTLGA